MKLQIVTKNNLSNNFRIVDDLLKVNIDEETIIEENGVLKSTSSYLIYEQSTPSSNWLIHHNLGKKPTIQVYNSDDIEIITGIKHLNYNSCIIILNQEKPKSGYCIINT